MKRSSAPSKRKTLGTRRRFVSPLLKNASAPSTKRVKVASPLAPLVKKENEPLSTTTATAATASTSSSTSRAPTSNLTPSLGKSTSTRGRRRFKPPTSRKRDSPDSGSSTSKSSGNAPPSSQDGEANRYYKVMWCKYSNKKHKTYNDGVLVVKGGKVVVLMDMNQKVLGKSSTYSRSDLATLKEENTLLVGGKECEIEQRITAENFESGAVFLDEVAAFSAKAPKAPKRPAMKKAKFKNPMKNQTIKAQSNQPVKREKKKLQPRHDPNAEGAIVLFRPSDSKRTTHVDVVVDPYLANVLRPHQRDGIKFLYQRIMGEGSTSCGCILADEMGLGKTLQAITLLWTALKQGPEGKPIARKALVVTPTSLTKNWVQEIKKWLGAERLKTLLVKGSRDEVVATIDEFASSPLCPVLVISYEQFRIHVKSVLRAKGIGLVICDEAHRLKNPQAQITVALNSVPTRRRLMLTGTPIQNNLDEFFAMVNFCQPGFMDYRKFRDVFAKPILVGREEGASPQQKKEAKARSAALMKRTSHFLLRRTKDLLRKFLPPRVEEVLFCPLSELQQRLYHHTLRGKDVSAALRGNAPALALSIIMSLRKLCNTPALTYTHLQKHLSDGKIDAVEAEKTSALFPKTFDRDCNTHQPEFAGKLAVLDALLSQVRNNTKDKVVIVSNFTRCLRYLELLCEERGYRFLRLDGQTKAADRQPLIDKFNSTRNDYFVFLLSSKAGSVGFNLVGANRLVMFDPDWNPANDAQAMGRVWRFGQTKRTYIYRLVATGTIEEKIFQRQIAKESLSTAVVAGGADGMTKQSLAGNKAAFSKEDLRDLFTYDCASTCDTWDLYETQQKSTKHPSASSTKSIKNGLEGMASYSPHASPEGIEDEALNGVFGAAPGSLSFVLVKITSGDDVIHEEEENGAILEDIISEDGDEEEKKVTEEIRLDSDDMDDAMDNNSDEMDDLDDVDTSPRQQQGTQGVLDDEGGGEVMEERQTRWKRRNRSAKMKSNDQQQEEDDGYDEDTGEEEEEEEEDQASSSFQCTSESDEEYVPDD